MYHINTLYTLNLHNFIRQLYLSKTGEKIFFSISILYISLIEYLCEVLKLLFLKATILVNKCEMGLIDQ